MGHDANKTEPKRTFLLQLKLQNCLSFFLTMYKDHFMSLTSEVSIVELDKALKGRSSYNLTQ